MTSANFWIDPVRTLPWWRAFNEDGDFFLYHEIASQYYILEGKASVALVETPVLTRTHHLHLPRFGLHFCGAIIVSFQSGGQHQDRESGLGRYPLTGRTTVHWMSGVGYQEQASPSKVTNKVDMSSIANRGPGPQVRPRLDHDNTTSPPPIVTMTQHSLNRTLMDT